MPEDPDRDADRERKPEVHPHKPGLAREPDPSAENDAAEGEDFLPAD